MKDTFSIPDKTVRANICSKKRKKNVQVLLIVSSETIYLGSQLRKGGILHIHNQLGENPVFF